MRRKFFFSETSRRCGHTSPSTIMGKTWKVWETFQVPLGNQKDIGKNLESAWRPSRLGESTPNKIQHSIFPIFRFPFHVWRRR